jgi:hypothetical protein
LRFILPQLTNFYQVSLSFFTQILQKIIAG